MAKNKHKSVRLVFDDLFSNMKHWILNNTNTDRQQCIAYLQFLPHFLNFCYLTISMFLNSDKVFKDSSIIFIRIGSV